MVYSLIIIACLLSLFGVYTRFSNATILVFLYEIVVILIVLFILLLKGIEINKYFEIHISAIRHLKDMFTHLKTQSSIYFEDYNYIPNNIIY